MSAPSPPTTRERPTGVPPPLPAERDRAPGPETAPAPAPDTIGTGTGTVRQGPTLRASVAALIRKELQLELRTWESVPAMTLFSVTTFVIFHFALRRGGVEGNLATGVLWVTLLLASLLGVNRLFVADADQGGFDGFLLAPADRTALLLAKVITLGAYLLVLELVAVPLFGLLLLSPPLGLALPGLLVVLALVDLGVAVIGTLVAALAVRTRARDLLGPLLALPLLVPLVIGAADASAPLLAAGGAPAFGAWLTGSAARWLLMLGLYDLLFGLLAYAVFDFLLED